jgi:hypothetical protein
MNERVVMRARLGQVWNRLLRMASRKTGLRAGVLWPPDVFGVRADQTDQPLGALCNVWDVIASESLGRARKSGPEVRNCGAQRGQ